MFAFQQAPFYDADEKAHLGYAHEIADLRLPEIERQPEVPASATQWQVERSTGRDLRYRACVGRQPPTAALRRRRPADLDRRGDRPGRRRPAVHAPRQRRLRRRRCRLHVPAGDRAQRRRTAHRPRRRGDRRPRPAGAHLLLACLNDGLAFAAGTALVVGGRSLPAPTRSPQPRHLERCGDGRHRHAHGDDAARHRGRRLRRRRRSRPLSRRAPSPAHRGDGRGDRARSGRRAVRVVLRAHAVALRRCRGVVVPAPPLRTGAAREHPRRVDAGAAVVAPDPADGLDGARCRGPGRASSTSSVSSAWPA